MNLRERPLSARAQVQKFGRFMSGMIMPNIGAFIAWGLITAVFDTTGWLPSARLSALITPMMDYLLPLLLAYTGGKLVWGTRGGVVGAVAVMGVIIGSDIPMLLGAMIMGPFGGWVIKTSDRVIRDRVPVGFEMLAENFSAGILGMGLALVGFLLIQPVLTAAVTVLHRGVEFIIRTGLLPLVSLFIEPGKILFLNNAINHGILGPLGMQQVQESGKSILFLLETNPGPGLGILLAYWVFSRGHIRASVPGAVIIHFFGGIHEVYFPYILMRPILILAAIGGGASGIFTFLITGAGEKATPSPGSIFSLIAVAPRGGLLPVLTGIIISCAVSFLIAMPFVKSFARDKDGEDALEEARDSFKEMKAISKGLTEISRIYFACDAGMGSSAMGASKLTRMLKAKGLGLRVDHCSVDDIPADAQLIISHRDLMGRVRASGTRAYRVGVTNLVNAPEYSEVVELIAASYKQEN
ncbi:MAG: PTS mannitol transporter subunit IICB [Spirochaetales bacterium]|nr:PTS mannitol transporter subunit IICB [Spirochaetales bacterium]